MERLGDMALFVEAVKARGLRGATKIIALSNATLSRRIALTRAGRVHFDRCKRIVDEARLAHERLDEMLAQPRPADAAFARRDPGISFAFDLTAPVESPGLP